MNLKVFTIIALLLFPVFMNAQVAINNSETSPDASAILDVSSPDRGLLIPRMVIADIESQLSPVESPADGLLIFNTGSAEVSKGVYMWSSDDAKWVEVITFSHSVSEEDHLYTPAGTSILPVL